MANVKDGATFVFAGKRYEFKNGVPRPVGPVHDAADDANATWTSLSDAVRVFGIPRAAITRAVRKGLIRSCRYPPGMHLPCLFVCHEDMSKWLEVRDIHPEQLSHLEQPVNPVGVSPEKIRANAAKRVNKLKSEWVKHPRRRKKKKAKKQ